jgi:hypothetical protein
MSHHYPGPDSGFPHGDARLVLTDLYAFPKPGDAGKSILIVNVHPSVGMKPLGPATAVAFAPEAIYEIKIDTDGDAVADIAYRVRFTSSESGAQTATLRRAEGAQAAGTGVDGQVIVEAAAVSTGPETRVTEAGDYRFFAGWRGDPFLAGEANAAYLAAEPADDARFVPVFAHALEHTGGYPPAEATRVAATLLPDVLHYDVARPASYPDNGRALTDDVVDFFLRFLTNGKVTQDNVGPHKDVLAAFPYVGPPHKARATKLLGD